MLFPNTVTKITVTFVGFFGGPLSYVRSANGENMTFTFFVAKV